MALRIRNAVTDLGCAIFQYAGFVAELLEQACQVFFIFFRSVSFTLEFVEFLVADHEDETFGRREVLVDLDRHKTVG